MQVKIISAKETLTDTSCDEGFEGSNLTTPESPILANLRAKFQSPSKYSPDKSLLVESPCRLGKRPTRKMENRKRTPQKKFKTGIDIIRKLEERGMMKVVSKIFDNLDGADLHKVNEFHKKVKKK